MKHLLAKKLKQLVEWQESLSDEQKGKVFVAQIAAVLFVTGFSSFLSTFVLQIMSLVILFVSASAFIVTAVFKQTERMEPVNKVYRKIGEWLAKQGDEPEEVPSAE